MARILAIEASTTCGSVALVVDGQLIGEQYYNIDKSHSSLLHVMIEQLMKNAGMALQEIDAVALAKGPGSYTGLRIGTSTAKGLCFALDKPLVAINTLEGMAHQATRFQTHIDYLCPMIDARRMEVYSTVTDRNLNTVMETQPVILDEQSFGNCLDQGTVLFFGDGSTKFKPVVNHENAYFIEALHPRAHDIGILGEAVFEQSAFENVVDFEPFYLKEFRTTTPKK